MKPFLRNVVKGADTHAGRFFSGTDRDESPDVKVETSDEELGQWAAMAAARWPAFMTVILQSETPAPLTLYAGANRDLDCLQQDSGARFWRQMTDRCWICFHEIENGAAPLDIAAHCYRELADCQARAIIAGAAAYPMFDDSAEQMVENAAKALDHAGFFGPGSVVVMDAVTLNVSGDRYYQQGRIEAAVREYQRGLRFNPKTPNLLNSLGVCHGELGRHRQALECFQTAHRHALHDYLAIYNMGMVHYLEKRYETALQYFIQAGQIAPDSIEVAFQTSQVYMRLNKPEDALASMQNIHRLQPESSLLWGAMGECLAALGKLPAAIIAYRQAVKFNPRDYASLSALGHLYDIQDENTDIAIVFCEQSIAMAPENGLYQWRLARLYQKAGRCQDALLALQAAASLGHADNERMSEIQKMLGAVATPEPVTRSAI